MLTPGGSEMGAEPVREYRLTGPFALQSDRSARYPPEDEHDSRLTVPCFVIRAGERFGKRLQRGRPRTDVQRPIDDLGDSMRRRIEHVLVGGSAGCHGQRGYPARSTERAPRLNDVAPDLAQHLAHVAELLSGPTEQLRSLADVHREVVRHSGNSELKLTDLLGDCGERLEVDLAPCGGGGVGGLSA